MKVTIQEIAKLQMRLDEIEKRNNRLKNLSGLLALLLVPLFLLGAKHGASDAQFGQITATRLTIRDASGAKLIDIGTDEKEGTGISIYNSGGKRVLTMGLPTDGQGSGLMVSDAEGRPRIGLGMDKGVPGIALVNEKGAKILAMGGDKNGYGMLISDGKEIQRIGLGFRDGNAGIMLFDENGQYLRGMFRQQDGLNYNSYIDESGKEIFE